MSQAFTGGKHSVVNFSVGMRNGSIPINEILSTYLLLTSLSNLEAYSDRIGLEYVLLSKGFASLAAILNTNYSSKMARPGFRVH